MLHRIEEVRRMENKEMQAAPKKVLSEGSSVRCFRFIRF